MYNYNTVTVLNLTWECRCDKRVKGEQVKFDLGAERKDK